MFYVPHAALQTKLVTSRFGRENKSHTKVFMLNENNYIKSMGLLTKICIIKSIYLDEKNKNNNWKYFANIVL